MMDKKFKIFGKISIVDCVLFFLFLGLIFIASEFAAPKTAKAAPGDTQILYTIELYKKPDTFTENIIVGETLYDSLKGYEIGKIVSVYDEPYKEEVDNFEKNIINRPEIDGLKFIYFTVEANAQINDQTTAIGQYEILVGKDVFVKSKSFASGGYIVSIEKKIRAIE